MPSHPDADAFMRNYLRTPHDTTARLVFADWLEETGRCGNVALAYYIRVMAAADRHPPRSDDRRRREKEAAGYARKIRARLTIPAALFVGYPKSLLQLLPAPNITVRLDGFEVPPAVLELMPESVARENLLLPLDQQGWVVLVAAGDPLNDDTARRLQFILNKGIVMVRAGLDELAAAIDRHYGRTGVETVDAMLTQFTDLPTSTPRFAPALVDVDPNPPPAVLLTNLILRDARQAGAVRVAISSIDGLSPLFLINGRWTSRPGFPRHMLEPVAARLAEMAGAGEQYEHSGRAAGAFRCAVGGDRFSVRVAIEPLDEGPVVQLVLADESRAAG